MRNPPTVFLGLFLVMFGLYAAQLKKKAPLREEVKKYAVANEEPEGVVPQARIQLLYEKITSQKMFSNKLEGVRVVPDHQPLKHDFVVTFYGDEVFSDEGFSIQENWNSALDSLARLIKTELGLNVEISGYADENNSREKKSSDYGSSPWAFSYARAEWLAHYFEHKHSISISNSLVLRGLGAVPQGKKVELRFYYR